MSSCTAPGRASGAAIAVFPAGLSLTSNEELHQAKRHLLVLPNGDCFASIFSSYKYHFPFLKTEELVTVEDNRVGPLYKHVFPPALAPWLSFVGLPWKVSPTRQPTALLALCDRLFPFLGKLIAGCVDLRSSPSPCSSSRASG